jgi:antitoxin HigA-1
MKPLHLTVNKLALELRVPATRIGEIVRERRRVTAEFWFNLQNFYDLELSKRSGKASEIERQIQPSASTASQISR